jgi:methionyl-tRNA formyltransferase
MRIGVAATPEVAIPTLDWLIGSEHDLVLVITQPDKPAGRGRNLKQSAVSDWASARNISIVKPVSSDDLVGVIDDLDCVLTIGYGVLLPQHILDLPKCGFINLHFSLLPAYRGAAPAQRALQNGETVTGISVFQLEKGMDTGPLYSKRSISIQPQWRSVELLQALSLEGPSAVHDALTMITTGQLPSAQVGQPSMAPKISKQDAQLNFSEDAQTLVNKVRAFTYEPGAWCNWKEEPFKITSATALEDHGLKPGVITIEGQRVIVGCGDNTAIEFLTVIPAGKKEMNAADWARGARLSGGENFG